MLERRVARGLPTPAFDNQPELFSDILPVWELFWELHAARRYDNGLPNVLTIVDIAAAMDMEQVEREDRKTWNRLIRAMDLAWMSDAAEKYACKTKTNGKGKGHKSGNAQGRNRRSRRNSRSR
jgi:hypothetical protein